ncbi:MAG: hypothetical protein J6K43_16260 [Lachnospiraceae bacterium]|nr:hypothetical protein [Lachnospiraceae bacterium]
MIPTLYEPFRHWSDGGSVYILSDLHFDDEDCKFLERPAKNGASFNLWVVDKRLM